MTPSASEYPAWARERAGIAPAPIAPADPDTPIARDDPSGSFRCDPFACRKVCCTGWPAGRGIRLTVLDLLRLREAGLLDSAEGTFAPPEEIAAWRADPEGSPRPESPRMRSADGHCLHYDPVARRCTIWAHRPGICRTFPYGVDWVGGDGTVHVTFAAGCSLVAPAPDETALARGEAVPRRYLAIGRARPTTPLGSLGEYERRHVTAFLESGEEQARTLELVTRRPELLGELGLGRFRAPPPVPEA